MRQDFTWVSEIETRRRDRKNSWRLGITPQLSIKLWSSLYSTSVEWRCQLQWMGRDVLLNTFLGVDLGIAVAQAAALGRARDVLDTLAQTVKIAGGTQ